jgi:PAS domain-containing protein
VLATASAVEDYFRAPPPKPDGVIAQQLQTDLNQLRTQHRQLQGLIREQRETLKDLGPARSWRHFLGSNPREVQAAEQRLEQTQNQSMTVASRIHQTEGAFASWQQEARTYLEWEGSEKGQQMHQCREIVQLEPVQERITQIHQAQEAIRQAQERQRQKEKALEALQGWKQMAIKLGRPQGYVQRIQEITEEYRQGKPLNENQRERMKQDLTAYQEQLRQVQVQQQRQGGFSL